jgi:hypothetical protein
LAVILGALVASEKCQYKNEEYDFKCDEPPRDADNKFCIFQDIGYLKGNNYEIHKEEVANRFQEKIVEYSSEGMPWCFIGYCLPAVSFQNYEFTDAFSFNAAIFYGNANFYEAIFSGDARFTGATFYKDAMFSGATFSSYLTMFSGATFSKGAGFTGAIFSGDARFTGATFSGDADFRRANFEGKASFVRATFSNEAGFDKATFSEANFFEATFSNVATFIGTTFSNEAGFKAADFDKATFSNVASFDQATFSNMASFAYTKFLNVTSFNSAAFSDESNFAATTFNDVSFSQTRFSEEANFRNVAFVNEAEFTSTTFCSGADFGRSIFSNAAYFSAIFKSETFFNYVRFENQNKIIFESEDMSKVSFINTDITRIRFSDKIAWGGKDKFTVIEEKWLEDSSKNIEERRRVSLGGILSVYRNLRENYEFRLQFDEAGKFFIREMELKRKYRQIAPVSSSSDFTIKKNGPFRRNIFSLIGWYHILSNYGESLWRPTAAGFLIVFSFTFFFVTQNNPALIPSFYTVFSNSSVIHSGTNNATHSSTNNTKDAVVAAKPDTNYSKFVGLERVGNPTQWQKAFERDMGDFSSSNSAK